MLPSVTIDFCAAQISFATFQLQPLIWTIFKYTQVHLKNEIHFLHLLYPEDESEEVEDEEGIVKAATANTRKTVEERKKKILVFDSLTRLLNNMSNT